MRLSAPLVSPFGRDDARNRILHSPGVPPQHLDDLIRLGSSAHGVTRHTPAASPARADAAELDDLLAALIRHRVPVDRLASTLGVSHQAVRRRAVRGDSSATPFILPPKADLRVEGTCYVLSDRSTDRLGRFEIRRADGVDFSRPPADVFLAHGSVIHWLSDERLPVAIAVSPDMLRFVVGIDPDSLR